MYAVVMNAGQDDEKILYERKTFQAARICASICRVAARENKEIVPNLDIMKILPDGTLTTEF